jgi:hypothetical protein
VNDLFQNLIWPAAAGNVAWAFFTVAVQEKWAERGVRARLVVLCMLAVYLAANWMVTSSERYRLKPRHWVAEAFQSVTIVVFAIATQLRMAWLDCSLAAVFFVTIAGHIAGLWEPTGKIEQRFKKRTFLAGINGLGLLLVLTLPYSLPKGSLWELPIAMGPVVTFWRMARKRAYPH